MARASHQGAGDHETHGLAEPFSVVTLHFGDRNGRLPVPKLGIQMARDSYSLVRGSAKSRALGLAKYLSAESDVLAFGALTHVVRGQTEIQGVFQLHRRVAPDRP